MTTDQVCCSWKTSLLNGNADEDRVAKRGSIGVNCLPGAFIDPFRKRRGKKDSDGCLRPGARRKKSDLRRRAQACPADVPQAVRSSPVAGAAVFHQPLLVQGESECGEHIVGDREVLNEVEVVRTFCRVYGRRDCWHGRGFDYHDFLRGLDNERRFDKWRLQGGWAERRWCGGGRAGCNEDENQNSGKHPLYAREAS